MIWIEWHHFWQESISEWEGKNLPCRQLSDKRQEFYTLFKIYCVLRLCVLYTSLEMRIDKTAINTSGGIIWKYIEVFNFERKWSLGQINEQPVGFVIFHYLPESQGFPTSTSNLCMDMVVKIFKQHYISFLISCMTF